MLGRVKGLIYQIISLKLRCLMMEMDTDLEEEATPLANEVHFISWLRGRDAGLHISNAYRS